MSPQRGERQSASPPAVPLRVIGTRPPLYGAVDKLTGRAVFGPDVTLPGLLHGKVLRSPHAHARIRAIDARYAEGQPAVHAVVTARDLPTGAGDRYARDNTLANDKVLYVGHAIAAVAAESPHAAEEALALIDVDYEVLPPVLDVRRAMQEGAPLLHEALRTRSLAGRSSSPGNVAAHIQEVKGDPERGFAEADVIVERSFTTTMVHQGYIEPHASTALWHPDGSLTVWTCTQGAFTVREHLAALLDLPMAQIRVVPTEIGGGFGGKGSSYTDVVAALLARKAGRPVKVVMGRDEVLRATGPTPGTFIRVRMGARRDGRITAAEAELCYEAGAYPGSAVDSGVGTILACYDIPHARVDGYDVVVNKPKTSSYRAPGATPPVFTVEQVVDELAERLGMDPIEFRLLNCAREGTRRVSGERYASVGFAEVLKAAREHPHYSAPLPGPNCGRGVAFGYWGNWAGQSCCTISVNADGTVSLLTGSVDVSGALTGIAMQAAEELGLDLTQVQARVADTASIGYTDLSAGSRTTFGSGLAAIEAARDVIAQMRARAARLWGVPVETVSYDRTAFTTSRDRSRRLSFGELAAELSATGGPVMGRGNVDGDVLRRGGAPGLHIADVEVDAETGRVTVLRYTAVQDVGRAIHPGNVEGQIKGGVAQGIGWALYEGCFYGDDGEMLNPNLLDYKLPTALDVPEVEPVIVEVPDPVHPYGVRGAGETPIVPVAGAIANAIYRVTGRRMERLPMSPAYVLERMGVI
ncbi:MAG: xanthine dehydrogenase family protein molybdopterin-binding subunit [Anaerolineae bacterium]|nr:xanthine dehydrogenase family protein molybdopterin-binding subunit [Anaerolineae bacterium]